LKLTLAHVLLKYDIQLAEGCHPKVVQSGLYTIVDPTVQLRVKRREGVDSLYT
jgi:fumitremorgin C monooxygenase